MKKDRPWRKIVALFIMAFLAFSAFWWGMMYLLDYLVPWLGKLDHHISGEIWFQLISSWLLALPSIGICAYAVLQTYRYHKLDDERLRPELFMKSAEISICMVGWAGFTDWAKTSNDIGERQLGEYERYRKRHGVGEEDKGNNLGYLVFKSDLLLKSGESVSKIMVSEIIVQIGCKQYIMKFADETQGDKNAGIRILFDRSYINGQEEYHIEWQPDYKSMEVQDEMSFWNDIYNAVGDPEYDTVRKAMEWIIALKIEYGTNKSQRKKELVSAEWRIRWSGDKREVINDYLLKQCSYDGVLSVG